MALAKYARKEFRKPLKLLGPSVKAESYLVCLTRREREVALLISRGSCNKEIAVKLKISERTVKAHLTSIFLKLGVSDRLQLAVYVVGHQSISQ